MARRGRVLPGHTVTRSASPTTVSTTGRTHALGHSSAFAAGSGERRGEERPFLLARAGWSASKRACVDSVAQNLQETKQSSGAVSESAPLAMISGEETREPCARATRCGLVQASRWPVVVVVGVVKQGCPADGAHSESVACPRPQVSRCSRFTRLVATGMKTLDMLSTVRSLVFVDAASGLEGRCQQRRRPQRSSARSKG